jgi:hypothetical protein
MARGRVLIAVAATLALSGGVSCGGSGGDGGDDGTPTEIVGVITEISRSGGTIDAITIRSERETQRVELDPTIEYGFDLEHLEEHRTTGDPVRCTVVLRGADLVATMILDA